MVCHFWDAQSLQKARRFKKWHFNFFKLAVMLNVSYTVDRNMRRIYLSKIVQKSKTNLSSPPKVFLGKSILEIWNKFMGEHPCRSMISIKFQSNLNEITRRHGCTPVNLLHIFRTPFYKNTCGWTLLKFLNLYVLTKLLNEIQIICADNLINNTSWLANFHKFLHSKSKF